MDGCIDWLIIRYVDQTEIVSENQQPISSALGIAYIVANGVPWRAPYKDQHECLVKHRPDRIVRLEIAAFGN